MLLAAFCGEGHHAAIAIKLNNCRVKVVSEWQQPDVARSVYELDKMTLSYHPL